ncbi:MAG TPA: hypothetical protein VMS74_02500, partial [Acidimicrobiia bacterium]|nr:hypothetical protein [Acidimicrobiia bacterium]
MQHRQRGRGDRDGSEFAAVMSRESGELVDGPVQMLVVSLLAGDDDVDRVFGIAADVPEPRGCRVRCRGVCAGFENLPEEVALGRVDTPGEGVDVAVDLRQGASFQQTGCPLAADAGFSELCSGDESELLGGDAKAGFHGRKVPDSVGRLQTP